MKMEVTVYLFFIIFLSGYEGVNGQCVPNTTDLNTNHPNDISPHNEFEPVLNGTESEKFCPQSGGGKLIIAIHDNNGEIIAGNNVTRTGFKALFNESVGVNCTAGTDVCPDYSLRFECKCPLVTEPSVTPAPTTSLHPATTSRQSFVTSPHSATPRHSSVGHSGHTGSTPSRQTSTPIKPTAHVTGASGIGSGGSVNFGHSGHTGSTPNSQTSTPIKPTAHATGASGIGSGGSGAATVIHGHLLHHVTVLLFVITQFRL